MIAAEYPALGPTLQEFRSAARGLDRCLSDAVHIAKTIDPAQAARIEDARRIVRDALRQAARQLGEPR